MPDLLVLLLVVAAGIAAAFQAPINASLARRTGPLHAAFLSFTGGALVLAIVVALAGVARLKGVRGAPAWMLIGGVLGSLYVVAFILAMPRIGVTAALFASLTGQLVASVWIDRAGAFGLPVRPLDGRRIAGLVLLAIAVWLVAPRRSG
jgi:transporter family-2 protein